MRSDTIRPEMNSGTEYIRTKRETLGRRPEVKREATAYSTQRIKKAERYRKGVEAASVFELKSKAPKTENAVSKVLLDVMKKNKRIFVTSCILFACAMAALIGTSFAGKVYTSNETFISDVTETGNITIADVITEAKFLCNLVSQVTVEVNRPRPFDIIHE